MLELINAEHFPLYAAFRSVFLSVQQIYKAGGEMHFEHEEPSTVFKSYQDFSLNLIADSVLKNLLS